MIKKNLKILIITSIIILLPMVAGLVLWNRLPEQVPFHWNAAGEVDGWASRPVAVFVPSAMMLALQWLCMLVTSADPKKQNHPEKVMHLVLWLIPIITVFISALMYVSALGVSVRVETLMPILLGLVFVAIGNYMPKCKQNYTIGIKIPWTLASEENWNRTHRLAGWVWVGGGFVMLLSGFLGIFWLTLVPAIIMVAVPLIYSYILHKKGI
jgi:uncharacterized membrane protein